MDVHPHSPRRLTGRELFEQNNSLLSADSLFDDEDGGGDLSGEGLMRLLKAARERKRREEEAAENGEQVVVNADAFAGEDLDDLDDD